MECSEGSLRGLGGFYLFTCSWVFFGPSGAIRLPFGSAKMLPVSPPKKKLKQASLLEFGESSEHASCLARLIIFP